MKRLPEALLVLALVVLTVLVVRHVRDKDVSVKVSAVPEAVASPQISIAPVIMDVPVQERDLKDWMEKLPTKSDLQGLSDAEVHSVPMIVAHAAEDLAAYAEAVRQAPNLRREALDFFKGCAEKDAVVDSLRAFCFNKAVTLQLELRGQVWDPESVPKNIKELATQL